MGANEGLLCESRSVDGTFYQLEYIRTSYFYLFVCTEFS